MCVIPAKAGIQTFMLEKSYYVYILASERNGTLYVGVTKDLIRRIYEHKNSLIEGFSKQYQVDKLVYFEETNSIQSAIAREKQMKKWYRKWKLELIESMNPKWKDLYFELISQPPTETNLRPGFPLSRE